MPRVFIPQHDGRFDISDAARFGEPMVVFRHDVFPDNADVLMPKLVERAHKVLGAYDFEHDFLALVGSPLHLAICSVVLGDVWPSALRALPIRLLRFDRLERAYYPIIMSR